MAPSSAPFNPEKDNSRSAEGEESYREVYTRLRAQGRDDAQIAAFLGVSTEALLEIVEDQ